MQQRPTLTPEEQALLHGHEQTIATARSVLDDLEASAFNVDEHKALLEQTEQQRRGLLERFSTTQYVPAKPTRARR
jgi:hypothetical protein